MLARLSKRVRPLARLTVRACTTARAPPAAAATTASCMRTTSRLTVSALAPPKRALSTSTAATSATTAPATATTTAAAAAASAAKPANASKSMFCFQCEQTQDQKGCTSIGVCGKEPNTAAMQDLLMELCKGVSGYARAARDLGGAAYTNRTIDRFVMEALFSTMTNVNFDESRFVSACRRAVALRDKAFWLYSKAADAAQLPANKRLPNPASASASAAAASATHSPLTMKLADTPAEMLSQAAGVGVLTRNAQFGADVNGLKELATYGLKGLCAYAEHCSVLGAEDDAVFQAMHQILDDIARTTDLHALLNTCLRVGELNYRVMALLDSTHTTRFGDPTPTSVPTQPVPGPCVLVSGHDLYDLEHVLKQCDADVAAGQPRVNVYTHGEMLPAHAYPKLKAYKSLVGHYGGPWQLQKAEFAAFPGAILMTSNCIIEPKKSYKSRIFTRRVVGWPGVTHLEGDDLSPLIAAARKAPGFTAEDCADFKTPPLQTGFGRNAVLSVAGTVVDGVKSGALKHFFVIGGCDGSEGERNYFRALAKATTPDTVILTLGCGKYRVNNLNLGSTSVGIPRVLDMGQCNDAYGAIQVALALAKAFGTTSVNALPLSFALSWFEQKAVAVLLTLLHLGVQNIRIGPHLPGFLTPTLVNVLTDKFRLMKCDSNDAKADLAKMMANH